MKPLLALALAFMIGSSASAQSAGEVAVLEFNPIRLTDGSGAKLEEAILRIGDQAYEVRVHGLGIGGATRVVAQARGEIQGLNRLTDLEDLFHADPAHDLDAQDLWLHSDAGVSIRLESGHPDLVIVPGGDAVSLRYGWNH